MSPWLRGLPLALAASALLGAGCAPKSSAEPALVAPPAATTSALDALRSHLSGESLLPVDAEYVTAALAAGAVVGLSGTTETVHAIAIPPDCALDLRSSEEAELLFIQPPFHDDPAAIIAGREAAIRGLHTCTEVSGWCKGSPCDSGDEGCSEADRPLFAIALSSEEAGAWRARAYGEFSWDNPHRSH